MRSAISLSNKEITLHADFFVHKDYSVTRKELLIDFFAENYTDQTVIIKAYDGENFDLSGFESFLIFLKQTFNIKTLVIETHDSTTNPAFEHVALRLGIFLSTGRQIPGEVNRDTNTAKFVGTMLGRFTLPRLRLAYELDAAFADDAYISFQPQHTTIDQAFANVSEFYNKEITWAKSKTFSNDIASTHPMGMIDWQRTCASYHTVWNRFKIEVICETDAYSNFWFTEKTARCLATGKPFVLVAGQGALRKLQDMGFYTFNSVIDEGYDNETVPNWRIKHLISSLKELYNNNTQSRLSELDNIAKLNIAAYKEYTSS